ncbi:MAG: DUF4340 domain-containing protein [Alphaproteobacteria bacterium]|nr:MAG: DUF4340 domain-containing protein [Alphaproteobacteria bacterium]
MKKFISRRDGIVALFTILAVIAAMVIRPNQIHRTHNDDVVAHPRLFPDLSASLESINQIRLEHTDSKVTMARNEHGTWTIEQMHGFPASEPMIRALMLLLTQSEIRAPKTSDPQRYADLGLDEEHAVRLQLMHGSTTLHDLWIGNLNRDRSATYVRREGQAQALLVSGRLETKPNVADWADRSMFSINASRIAAIRYQFSEGQNYQFSRLRSTERLALLPQPNDGRKEREHRPLDPAVFFERILFTDVLPASKAFGTTPDVLYVTTFDGLMLTIYFHSINDAVWARFHADADPDIRDESQPNIKPMLEVAEEAQAINERTRDWLYALGNFQLEQFRRPYDAYVE